MSKWPRIVVPGLPHHVTHRGTRRQTVFFGENDFKLYQKLLRASCIDYQVEIWAYCLMPNHVHIIAVPETIQGLSKAFGIAHQAYSRIINSRFEWKGHLWEQRYNSIPMDEPHLLMAARYVEQNPVRAGLVYAAENYRWSSAIAHFHGRNDAIAETSKLLEMVPNWPDFIADSLSEPQAENFRKLEKLGYPAGSDKFLKQLETQYRIQCRPKPRGPKPKIKE